MHDDPEITKDAVLSVMRDPRNRTKRLWTASVDLDRPGVYRRFEVDHIVRADQRLLLLNTLHLMFIAFLPFPTAVLAQSLHDAANEPLATSFYSGTLTLIRARTPAPRRRHHA